MCVCVCVCDHQVEGTSATVVWEMKRLSHRCDVQHRGTQLILWVVHVLLRHHREDLHEDGEEIFKDVAVLGAVKRLE